jgi:uncharacterized RDD family membrane protein YckC
MAISIETTQNVTIEYDLASVGDRILGQIVDSFVILAYFVVMVLLIGAVRFEIGIAGLVILYLPILLYAPLCEIFLDGQTLGKKAMKTKVVRVDGTEPSVGSYLLRWLLMPIDQTFFIGLLLIAIGGKGQRLGDLAAGTTVIKIRPRFSLYETLMPELEEEYTPSYPEVTSLSDRDIAIIREVWAAGRTQTTHSTLVALAERVATVIGVARPADPELFLETVVRDYTWYTQGTERV